MSTHQQEEMKSYTLQELIALAKERNYEQAYMKTLNYFETRKMDAVLQTDCNGKKIMNPFFANGFIDKDKLDILKKQADEANGICDYLDTIAKYTLEQHITRLAGLIQMIHNDIFYAC